MPCHLPRAPQASQRRTPSRRAEAALRVLLPGPSRRGQASHVVKCRQLGPRALGPAAVVPRGGAAMASPSGGRYESSLRNSGPAAGSRRDASDDPGPRPCQRPPWRPSIHTPIWPSKRAIPTAHASLVSLPTARQPTPCPPRTARRPGAPHLQDRARATLQRHATTVIPGSLCCRLGLFSGRPLSFPVQSRARGGGEGRFQKRRPPQAGERA